MKKIALYLHTSPEKQYISLGGHAEGKRRHLVMLVDSRGRIEHVQEWNWEAEDEPLFDDAVEGPRLEITAKEYEQILREWDEAEDDDDEEDEETKTDEEKDIESEKFEGPGGPPPTLWSSRRGR